jgi:hypothetical protein
MDLAGVSSISIEGKGNHAPFEIAMVPYYSANIAASWSADRRAAAFSWLHTHGHSDLIKTDVVARFGRDQSENARVLAQGLHAEGYNVSVKEGVHPQTLTAWFKEQVDKQNPLPPLDVIGASMGRIARMKEIKS